MSDNLAPIRTRYKTRPGSNNGKIVATWGPWQATRRYNQALSSDTNHLLTAGDLAAKIAARLGIAVLVGAPVRHNDPALVTFPLNEGA